jgi:hypothetical protein
MGKRKSSPPPYVVKPDYGQENVYRLWDKNGNYHDDTSPEAMDANAALFNAAPDLLKALKSTLSWLTSYPGGGALNQYEKVRGVIANAEK